MISKLLKIFFVVSFSLVASGQWLTPAQAQLSSDPVQYIVSPEIPGPNQTVQIEVQGVGNFLGDSTVSWYQDGKLSYQGVGARTFTLTTGALGSKITIEVRIKPPSQATITHSFVFYPSLVSLVWEANTTAPPFYRGKPLYSAGSQLKVVAFPVVVVGGKQIASKNLSYQWSRNDNSDPSQSGLGRSTYIFMGDQLQTSETVAVDVYAGTAKVAHNQVTIPATSPQLLLYDKDPLRGVIWDSALPGAFTLNAKELTVQAVPYYFSNQSAAQGTLGYTWTLNGNEVTGPDTARGLLTLRQTGVGQGGATLSVAVQNSDNDKLVQAAQAAAQIIFGGTSQAGALFGL